MALGFPLPKNSMTHNASQRDREAKIPRNGSNVYAKPAGTTAVTATTIESAKYNSVIDDLVTDANTARPIVAGGTAATTAAGARTALGLVIGTDVQAYDADLTVLGALVSAADRLPYFTGAGTASLATFTAAGRAIVDDADAAAQRTTLGLAIGTDVAAIASPTFTGVPAAPTAAAATNTTQLATTAFVLANSGGMTLLGTLTTTSGTAQTLSGLVLTSYKTLFISVKGVSSDNASYSLRLNALQISEASGAAEALSGAIFIDLTTSVISAVLARAGLVVAYSQIGTYTTASTSISFTLSAGNFDAGSICVYGVK